MKKKSQNAENIKRGDALGFFKIHSVAKIQQKLKGNPSWKNFFSKKSIAMPKKTERGNFWSRPVLYVTRETFLVRFLGPTGTIWRFLETLYNFWG